MHEFKSLCAAQKVIPVLTPDHAESTFLLCRALVEGGLRLLEITLRTPQAWDIALRVKEELPLSLVGIGTALSPSDMEKAARLGFHFVVSPGMTPSLLDCWKDTAIPYLPGVSTPSEIMFAQERGLDFLKFFPAEQNGGAAKLKSYASPFAGVSFCPTGGVNAGNVADYLSLPNVVCVGGTWLADRKDMAAGRWDAIRENAARFASIRTNAVS